MKTDSRAWVLLVTSALILALWASCVMRPAQPTPGPTPEKVHGSKDAIADGGRGRGHSLEDMGFQRSARVASVEFAPVYFELNQAMPAPDQLETLRTMTEEIPRFRSCTIAGHTCPLGETVYNAALGYHRAQAVLTYLRTAGVRTGFQVLSYGEERLVGFTPSEFHLNRRVVVECVK